MTMHLRAIMMSLGAALLPGVAWAHGGHAELGAAHAIWHVLPWLVVAGSAGFVAAWVRRAHRRR